MSSNNQQTKCLNFLFKKAKGNMIVNMKKIDSSDSAFTLLENVVDGIIRDINKKGKKKSCCGGSNGSEFIEVLQEMQEGGQIKSVVSDVQAAAPQIKADPKKQTKMFIEELFVIIQKRIDGKLEIEVAATEDAE